MSLQRFTKKRFLLCEGDDDKGFFESLIRYRRLPDFQVCCTAECNTKAVGGVSGFAKSIEGMEVLYGFRDVLKALLFVSDNDILGKSFEYIQRALTMNGYTAPNTHDTVGQMAGKPVAIFMIPRHDKIGDLETLCLPTIHAKWPTAEGCVNSFLQCSGATGWTHRASINKARVRSATVGFNERDPYKRIGDLFKNRTLSVNHACFDEIALFLSRFDTTCGI